MPEFTSNEWIVLILIFLLGLVLGMAAMAGTKWKTRYREEVRKREAAEADRSRLESQLKHSEARVLATQPREPIDTVTPVTRRDTPIA